MVQKKSFTKAAEQLRISQPAVSQHILELEKHLGVKLFERQRGETVLTHAGRVFLVHAEQILSSYDNLEKIFTSFEETEVRIMASQEIFDYIINELLPDFIGLHPEISFVRVTPDEDAEIEVTIGTVQNKKGMFALGFHPSDSFVETPLCPVLFQILEPTL